MVWTVTRKTTLDSHGSVKVGARRKTGRVRRVVLVPRVVDALRAHSRVQAAQRLRAGEMWADFGLVFPTWVGTPQDARNLRKDFREVAARAGFPGSFHSLRHYCATAALATAPEAVVSQVLGHARRSTTTDVYGHLRGSDAERIAVAVSVAVNLASPQV